MFTNYWGIAISEYQSAWYATGDLMFRNFEYCHFKMVLEDVHSYCGLQTSDSTKVPPSKYDHTTP